MLMSSERVRSRRILDSPSSRSTPVASSASLQQHLQQHTWQHWQHRQQGRCRLSLLLFFLFLSSELASGDELLLLSFLGCRRCAPTGDSLRLSTSPPLSRSLSPSLVEYCNLSRPAVLMLDWAFWLRPRLRHLCNCLEVTNAGTAQQ